MENVPSLNIAKTLFFNIVNHLIIRVSGYADKRVAFRQIVEYTVGKFLVDTLVETNETELKWSGAGLNALYISLGIAILAVIYAEVAKKFN